jgi:DNA-binding MarR family transcriptional regulator
MGDTDQPAWRRAATRTLHTSLVLKVILEEHLQLEAGMLLADNEALLNIGHSPEPLRMSEVAHLLILSPGGTTKVIDRLEEMGHVVRVPDPEDRRATLLSLTDSGREAVVRNRKIIDAMLQEAWAGHITDQEAAVVIEVMDRVMQANHGTFD